MPAIFVHLSDIHFGQELPGGPRKINEDARQGLIEDAASVISGLPGGAASGILVTGDIAYAGKHHEYEDAGKWLDELAARVGCAPSDIQMVPGNHDVDRDKIEGATKFLLDSIHRTGETALDEILADPAGREALYTRFEHYRHFAAAYECPLDCEGQSSAERKIELAQGRFIRFVRLNSALTCTKGREEKGALLLGKQQRVMRAAPGEELVVLTHHPLSWCADSQDTRNFLRGRARMFISGHEHLAAVSVEEVEDGCSLMMLAAGATTPDKVVGNYTYAYNVIQFDWDENADALAVTLHLRAWNDNLKRFASNQDRLEKTKETTVLGSPNFAKAPRPTARPRREPAESPPPVKIIRHIDSEVSASPSAVSETEYRNLHLRFFRDISEGDRLRIFAELDAIVGDMDDGFTHSYQTSLLRELVMSENKLEVLCLKVTELVSEKAKSQGEE